MNSSTYDIWALRINRAIREKKKLGSGGKDEQGAGPSLKRLLLTFAGEAEAVVGAVNRNVEDVAIQGGGRLDTLGGFLDEMLKFEEFSLLEYRYLLPENRQPGLRFKVEIKRPDPQISVIFFKDLVFWDVNESGKRMSEEFVRFDLSGGDIRAVPSPEYIGFYQGCGAWQEVLRKTLTLPFRELYG